MDASLPAPDRSKSKKRSHRWAKIERKDEPHADHGISRNLG
jgi:hypothetical protein